MDTGSSQFTKGEPFLVAPEDVKKPWGGYRDGRNFRCGCCGHRFSAGDVARWQMLTHKGFLNIFVCTVCDKGETQILATVKALRDEFNSDKFWLFRRCM